MSNPLSKTSNSLLSGGLTGMLATMVASRANAEDAVVAAAKTLNSGDTAWVIVSAALILLMTIPGIALFYAGLVRRDNVLTTVMQSFAVCCLVGVLWPLIGYSLAFTGNSAFIGGLDLLMLQNLPLDRLKDTIPELAYIIQQGAFAAIAVAIILGSVADRIKFSAVVVFSSLWLLLVYCPVAHWVWHPAGLFTAHGGLFGLGAAIDFAGGTVIHINAGIAGLVMSLVIGRRLPTVSQDMPYSIIFSVIGASFLWIGWFGFNGGSALTSSALAANAILVTNACASMCALAWMLIETIHRGKPSVIGALTGAVSGLVCITPAAGYVTFTSSLFMAIIAAVFCYWAVHILKKQLKYDDSLDVFGVHGIAGILGGFLVGIFATKDINSVAGLLEGNSPQIWAQILSMLVTIIYSGIATYIICKVTEALVGLRVSAETEKRGLDMDLHGETV
jgi:Amt family ammonium transporter